MVLRELFVHHVMHADEADEVSPVLRVSAVQLGKRITSRLHGTISTHRNTTAMTQQTRQNLSSDFDSMKDVDGYL